MIISAPCSPFIRRQAQRIIDSDASHRGSKPSYSSLIPAAPVCKICNLENPTRGIHRGNAPFFPQLSREQRELRYIVVVSNELS